MKKKISLILVLSLIFCLMPTGSISASSLNYDAASSDASIEYFEDGSYVITEFYEEKNNDGIAALSTETTTIGYKISTYYSSSDVALCALKITGTFTHDGIVVSCIGKKSTTYSYDDAWSVEEVSLSQGSTSTTKCYATASGKFVKRTLGITVKRISTSITVYCDKMGSIF